MSKPAARMGDQHPCPLSDGPKPHGVGTIMQGEPSVLIEGMAAARVGDQVICATSPAPNAIVAGSATVLIKGQPAARVGDQTAHGGTIVVGATKVLIGG
ncbi:PAAR domain-containing protein [candidate division KSB1 bacterium]|nr:PAAR domain-containing protein [candidate division KSB1 bacterium]